MMIIMRSNATDEQIADIVRIVETNGLRAHLSRGVERTVIGAIGDGRPVDKDQFMYLPGVDRIVPISRPFKLASREFRPQDSVFPIDGMSIGGSPIVIIAGPCAVESRQQLLETAHAVREAGAHALRGGAFKPRTSPYSFQGLGEDGLQILAEARQVTGLPVVTEVMSPEQVSLVAQYADVLQIGARNMQNYSLLHMAGESQHPVLIKRGMSATMEELLMAAEYVLSHGNRRVILCERGIRTFETATRNTLDISAVPVVKGLSHLPIIVDPSHSGGHKELVAPLSRVAVAAGADGFMVDVHPAPETALVDGAQAILPAEFAAIMKDVRDLCAVMGLEL